MSRRTSRPPGFSLISFPSFDLFLRKLQARSSFGARTRPVIRPDRRGLDHRTTRPRGPVTPPHALFERGVRSFLRSPPAVSACPRVRDRLLQLPILFAEPAELAYFGRAEVPKLL